MVIYFPYFTPLTCFEGILEVYEPWVSRMDANVQHNGPIEQFPWLPAQNAEAHQVVAGLVECISMLLDAYPQVENFEVIDNFKHLTLDF